MNEDVYLLLKPADFPAIAMLIFVCGYGWDFFGVNHPQDSRIPNEDDGTFCLGGVSTFC